MGAILDKIARLVGWLRAAENLYKWAPTLLTAALYGGTVIWAFITSVPLPLLVMNGITLLLVIIWLPFMPGLYRLLRVTNAPIPVKEPRQRPEPQYALWRRLDRYSIDQIAYLWIDADPHLGVSVRDSGQTETIRTTFRNAIKSGKLRPISGARDDVRYPTGATEIARADLIAYAAAHGDNPKFLQDTD